MQFASKEQRYLVGAIAGQLVYMAGLLTLLQLSYLQVLTSSSVRFERLCFLCVSIDFQHRPSQRMNTCLNAYTTYTDDALWKWQYFQRNN